MTNRRAYSRRQFLFSLSVAPLVPAFLPSFQRLIAAERKRAKIRDVQVMIMQGPGRSYTLVKISSDNGLYGIAEAYGTPGVGVKEQILSLKPWLIGKDALEIDRLYTQMGAGASSLSGTRTDGSAHNLMRAVSGIEMALWDLAGKTLEVPTSTLLGGRFREKVRVYDHAGPRNQLDKSSTIDWAAKAKAHPSGFTCHKFGLQTVEPSAGAAARGTGRGNGPGDGEGGGGGRSGRGSGDPTRMLSPKQLVTVQKGFENCREAMGWDHDIMVHCSWDYDLRTAIQIADAVTSSRPVWLEDPLPVDYTDSWKRLCEVSKVPICTGENLTRREGFLNFIVNQGAEIIHPDLRNSGGFLETKRVADMAHIYGLPMANHNTGSQVNTYASAQWASTIRDYVALETITGEGDWMDKVLLLDGPYIKDGFIQATDKPGLGIELNPDVVRAHLAPGEAWWA